MADKVIPKHEPTSPMADTYAPLVQPAANQSVPSGAMPVAPPQSPLGAGGTLLTGT